ncbi:Choline-sulfatase [Rubripirellula reticaptiva]|uniref:Choline-sulfatase n=1 Tax=Rubripirellula reticaptiva TaxID=2528013 RepID=A0A5C6FC93_9BACT|nr:Choline-sulfatase [Rubripirellula reticaptiva]
MLRLFLLLLLFAQSGLLFAEEPAKVRNVLFIVSDDLKASVLGCYGDPLCKTPNIDELAARSMVFDKTYCQGLVCGPSRQSFMFSRYVGASGSGPSMAEHFKNNGWYTARVGKIYHMRVPGDIIAGTNGVDHAASWTERFNAPGREAHTPGLYSLLNQNIFTTEEENRQSTGDPHRPFVTVESEGDGTDQPDYKAATKAIELMREHKDNPFFLAVGFVRPHYPMVAPPNYFEPYPIDKITAPQTLPGDHDDIPKAGLARSTSQKSGISKYPDNVKRMWAGYYAAVTFMDVQVGRVLGELDRLGLRDNTVVVFTSDHGYHLGEHEFWLKSNVHEEVTHVPLIVFTPGRKSGRAVTFAELVDIYPTVSELAGLSIPSDIVGHSLVPAIADPTAILRDIAYSGGGKQRSLRNDQWSYMNYGKDGEELYDMQEDPGQFTNLAKNSRYAEVLNGFRERLSKIQ